MNKLIQRLLKKHLPDAQAQESVAELTTAFSDVIERYEQDRLLLERSLTLTSDELNDINQQLKTQLEEVKHIQQELEKSLAKQQALLNASPEAVLSFKQNGTIAQANRAALEFIGLDKEQALALNTKQTLTIFLNKISNPSEFMREIRYGDASFSEKKNGYFDTIDGKHFQYQSEPEILEGNTLGRVFCFRDITIIKQNQAMLRHQAFHDTLTGLPNRAYLSETVSRAIKQARRNHRRAAILFIDLDDFKKINDTSGHEQGDHFLKEVSKKIKDVLRETDTLGRLGGDEFLVVLEEITNQSQTMEVVERILSLFESPFEIERQPYIVTCSIGIALFPQDGETQETLIRKADMAMYQAKKLGKNTFHYFDESLERLALHRVKIEQELRLAIDNSEFVLHFQPKFNLANRRVVGLEALIRWQKNDGLVFPDQFLPVAEDLGLITHLSCWVIEQACNFLNAAIGTHLEGLSLSVNLSALDFSSPEFLDLALSIIDKKLINKPLLEIELTESVLFDNLEAVNQAIHAFKERSMKVSIDDFGTGYSSFSYIKDLSIDFLKIDKSFVINMENEPKSQAIVKSIIDLGQNLNISVVAEGIENEEELLLLENFGCNLGQGYFYSRPLNNQDLNDFIVSHTTEPCQH